MKRRILSFFLAVTLILMIYFEFFCVCVLLIQTFLENYVFFTELSWSFC